MRGLTPLPSPWTDPITIPASVLKQRSSATNVWIARQLNMGVPQAVTIHVGSLDKVKLGKTKEYQDFIYEFTK